MKKLLVLGGASAQVPVIQAAKKEGYYVVLCDWTTTNPGIPLADKHYQVSTLDRDAVYEVAVKENVDGVISNSEAAMPNVSYIAEQLGLRGNPLNAVETLLSKDKFRTLQEAVGVYAPKHHVAHSLEEYLEIAGEMPIPFIVKPVESSGSRGTTKITAYDREKLIHAYEENTGFSRNGLCSVEEYVEMPSLTVVEGDIFVLGKEILFDGLFFDIRSKSKPMLPMADSLPLRIPQEKRNTIETTLRKILEKAGIVFGELNVEMYYTSTEQLFVIEINPRQGGFGVPEMICLHNGIDMHKLLVTTAVKDDEYFHSLKTFRRSCVYLTRHTVFAHKEGVYEGVEFSPEIRPFVKSVFEYVPVGTVIEDCKNATSALALVDLQYDDFDTQHKFYEVLEEHITPKVSDLQK